MLLVDTMDAWQNGLFAERVSLGRNKINHGKFGKTK